MKSSDVLEGKKLLKQSKAMGTKYTTKLEDEFTIFILNKNNNSVYEINFVKDKRTSNKYFVKSDEYGKTKFVADGSVQAVFFGPLVLAKIGASTKSKDNIYFEINNSVELYQ